MPKGYWIAHIDVDDPEPYKSYMPAAAASIAAHGGRYIVRAGRATPVEGATRSRNVVVEFPSFEAAVACYESEQYRSARGLRTPHSRADIVIVEGTD